MTFIINDVAVTSNIEDFTEDEARKYIDYVLANADVGAVGGYVRKLVIDVKLCDDGKIDVNYELNGQKFERIRRITGYLTGDVSSWNNSKRAEERERVKHDL